MWKEAVVVYFGVLSQNLPRGLRKNMPNLSTDDFRVAICTLDLQHVKQEFYTFKCRVRPSGLVLDIAVNIDI